MDWKDVGKKVAGFAPLLGGALGGPAGAALGSIIAATLGTEAEPDAIMSAIERDPAAAAKLQGIQAEQRTRLAEIQAQRAVQEEQAETERLRIAALDRDAARARDVKVREFDPRNRRADMIIKLDYLGLALMLGAMFGGLWLTKDMEPSAARMVLDVINSTVSMLAGIFVAGLRDVHVFEFGSSRGSSEKQDTISATIKSLSKKEGA